MEIIKLQNQLNNNLYCHIKNFENLISFNAEEKSEFISFWERLKLDQNFKDYTHRERRILRYIYQVDNAMEIDYNSEYNSSIKYQIKYTQGTNKLAYVEEQFINNKLMQNILAMDIKILTNLLDRKFKYSINIHLFRVIANMGKISPTTSGIHQDGMDFICMHYINSGNIYPVISKLYKTNSQASEILNISMNNFLESLIIEDSILYHSASEVKQVNIEQIAFRDLLLITFNKTNTSIL
jgi:hypothetical protein